MTYEIRLILPVNVEGLRLEEDVQEFGVSDARISVQVLKKASPTEDGRIDTNVAIPEMVGFAIAAERDGIDAVLVDCMGDTSLSAIREAVSIPALGPAQTAMYFAAMLGRKFSVLTSLPEHHTQIRELARSYDLETHLGPPRSLGMSVLAAMNEVERTKKVLSQEAIKAVREDETEVIILGCTSMSGMGPGIKADLANANIKGIPVIDPIPLAIRTASIMIACDLSHSQI
jgi:allantoin racemase